MYKEQESNLILPEHDDDDDDCEKKKKMLYIYVTYCWQNPILVVHMKAEATHFSSDWK